MPFWRHPDVDRRSIFVWAEDGHRFVASAFDIPGLPVGKQRHVTMGSFRETE